MGKTGRAKNSVCLRCYREQKMYPLHPYAKKRCYTRDYERNDMIDRNTVFKEHQKRDNTTKSFGIRSCKNSMI